MSACEEEADDDSVPAGGAVPDDLASPAACPAPHATVPIADPLMRRPARHPMSVAFMKSKVPY
jgi:hypothetical protein